MNFDINGGFMRAEETALQTIPLGFIEVIHHLGLFAHAMDTKWQYVPNLGSIMCCKRRVVLARLGHKVFLCGGSADIFAGQCGQCHTISWTAAFQ